MSAREEVGVAYLVQRLRRHHGLAAFAVACRVDDRLDEIAGVAATQRTLLRLIPLLEKVIDRLAAELDALFLADRSENVKEARSLQIH